MAAPWECLASYRASFDDGKKVNVLYEVWVPWKGCWECYGDVVRGPCAMLRLVGTCAGECRDIGDGEIGWKEKLAASELLSVEVVLALFLIVSIICS